MSLRSVFWILPAVVLLSLSARRDALAPASDGAFYSAPERAFRQSSDDRDTILPRLRSLKQDAFAQAFTNPPTGPFTRYTYVEQRGRNGHLLATSERTVRYRDGESDVLLADTTGAFDFGFLSGFVADHVSERWNDLTPHLLPEDPPYLRARNRDAFSYHQREDTTLWGVPVDVLEIRTRPEASDNQSIRFVRLFVSKDTDQVMALDLERQDDWLLYQEGSHLYAQVRPGPDGTWVPALVRITSRLELPLRPTQVFRAVTAYYDYAP